MSLISETRKRQLVRAMRQAVAWGHRRLPPGARTLVGLAFIVGGFLGFLPVLGFWMIPIGLVLIASDIPPVRYRLSRWLRQRDRTPRR